MTMERQPKNPFHPSEMLLEEAHIDNATIKAIAQLIVERFAPEQVILFGSHARGEGGSHSDVDLLVVLRTGTEKLLPGNPIRRAIAERFVLPVDVLIRSPEVLAEQRNDPYSLMHQVLEEGKILYERHVA